MKRTYIGTVIDETIAFASIVEQDAVFCYDNRYVKVSGSSDPDETYLRWCSTPARF